MKKPSEYPKANHSSYSEGETLWHRAFFVGLTRMSSPGRYRPAEVVSNAAAIADAAMDEIERREKGEA